MLEVLIDKPYLYDADAIDPNDDILSYELLLAPEGMTINDETALHRCGMIYKFLLSFQYDLIKAIA